MSDVLFFWSGIWLVLLIVFLVILYKEKNRKLYFLYFLFAMIFGLYFDTISVAFGYYSYSYLFVNIFGVPLSMTIAEGFSIVIVIRLFEIVRHYITIPSFHKHIEN